MIKIDVTSIAYDGLGRVAAIKKKYNDQDSLERTIVEQSDFKVYAATMETANAVTEAALFSNIEETRAAIPVGYPTTSSTEENKSVAKLVNTTGTKK